MDNYDAMALVMAVQMIEHGIPVFVAKPDPRERDGFRKPSGWQRTPADTSTLVGYQPGDALCMVCGHGLDVIDVDIQNGGDKHRGAIDQAGLTPQIYGTVRTPSGGTHEFVRSLNVRKQQDVWPGIDVQAGDEHGEGRGFVYIAPTVKKSKITNEMRPYVWEQPIDWTMFDAEHAEDDTGDGLAALIRSTQTASIEWEPYEGKAYAEFEPNTREEIDRYVAAALHGIASDLSAAKKMGPGERTPRGAGWEKITAYAAFRLAQLALAPWCEVGVDQAWAVLKENAPTDNDWTMFDVEQKFKAQAKLAAKKPLPLPSDIIEWGVGDHPEGAVPPDLPDEVQRDFWGRKEYLAIIREFAYARMASPWAVLGVAICRALCTVPPHVTLPPIVGGRGSLNMFVALVGEPGAGKDAAMAAARDVYPGPLNEMDAIHVCRLGSAEGIAHVYMDRLTKDDPNTGAKKGDLVQVRRSALFQVSEIDTLIGLGNRNGNVLIPTLREAFVGADISFGWADKTKRLPMAEHSYRLCMVMGVQPTHAKALLEDAGGGFPQRMLWLPATDPDITDEILEEPSPLPVFQGSSWAGSTSSCQISLPVEVVRLVRAARAARARGDKGGLGDLDGHALFVREKVAMALAVLDQRTGVTMDDWELSEIVMQKSDAVRARVEAAIRREAEQEVERAGHAMGVQQAVSEEAADQRRIQRIAKRLLRRIQEGCTLHSDLKRTLAGSERHLFEESVQRLVGAGLIIAEDASGTGTGTRGGVHYRCAE